MSAANPATQNYPSNTLKKLPPLILHPFNEQIAPSSLLESSRAALMLSGMPSLPAWRIKEIMEQTARELGPPGKDNDFGAGLIDAFAAVSMARQRKP